MGIALHKRILITSEPCGHVTSLDTQWADDEDAIDSPAEAAHVVSFVDGLPPITNGHILALLLDREAKLYPPWDDGDEMPWNKTRRELFIAAARAVRNSMIKPTAEECDAAMNAVARWFETDTP